MCPLINYIRATGWIKKIESPLSLSVENIDRMSSNEYRRNVVGIYKVKGKLFDNEHLSHENQ